MIKSTEAKFFRKHEDLHIDFTKGLNVLRGPNEIGKTTITEVILYCLYGSGALVDRLDEVVTWGRKESDLRGQTVLCISDIDYVFTRSKNGAECNYTGIDGKALKVTGQKEVTAFAATLLGADAKTASVLMLSSQAGLRGALDEGATAVGALMGKLADFDTIDTLLENAAATLSLGTIVPLQAKLAEADVEVLAAQQGLVDPAALVAQDAIIVKASDALAAAMALQETLMVVMDKAEDTVTEARYNNTSFQAATQAVLDRQSATRVGKEALATAQAAAAKKPADGVIAAKREELAAAKSHAVLTEAYRTYSTLGQYPLVAWDEPKETFDLGLKLTTDRRDAAAMAVRDIERDIKAARLRIISGDGKCPSCGATAANHDHVIATNAGIELNISALQEDIPPHAAIVAEAQADIDAMISIEASAKKRQTIIDKVSQYLVFDISCYPQKVTWSGPPPDLAPPNVGGIKSQLDDLEAQERAAVQAEGRVSERQSAIAMQERELVTAQGILDQLKMIAMEPLKQSYDAAYVAYANQGVLVSQLRTSLDEHTTYRAETARLIESCQARLAAAQARVVELVADIKTMEFNNELVKKLKSMKPLITDFLWNSVLAAVSNFFSQLRGEQSVVTKDATGFKVNGRGGSLSGSTLDMLALAIRVALSKTFAPSSSFLILDEPAHGCDEVRAGSLLGFLSGAGFQQTILASHDELSESVADNVITLGA